MTDICPLCHSDETFVLQRTEPLAADDPLVKSTLADSGQVISFFACRRCNLVFRSPRPSPEHLAHYYQDVLPPLEPGIMAELGVTEAQGAQRNAVRYEQLFHAIRPISGKRSGQIVDVGGWDGQSLLPWHEAGWRTTLVEPGAKLRKLASPVIRAVQTPSEAVSTTGEKADIVTSYHCIEHLLDIKAWLEDVRQLSKPGTLWIIEVPFELIYVRGLTRRARLTRPAIHDQHLNFFTPESLIYVGKMAGLRATRVDIVVTPYWFGPTVSLRLRGVQAATNTSELPHEGRSQSRLRMRTRLSMRLPLWRRVAGVKYRYYRFRHPDPATT